MKNITGESNTKSVRIMKNGMGGFVAMFIQTYNNEEQVLDSRDYGTEKGAIRWGNKKLLA